MSNRRLPLYFTLSAFAISANAVPPLLSTMSAELALPAWTLGAGITIQYISFSAIAWLGGMISARRGITHRTMIVSGLLVLSLALLLAPYVTASLVAVLIWMGVLGFSGGSVETFASISLTEDSPSASSKSLCISQAFFALGAFVAPQVASFFLERLGGWKSVFLVLGGLASAVTLFFLVFGRRRAQPPSSATAAGTELAKDVVSPSGGLTVSYFRILLFTYVLVETLLASWIPFMLENQRNFSVRNAASAASFFWFGMIFGRIAIVVLPNRLTLWPALTVSSLSAVAASIALPLFPDSSRLLLFAFGFMMGPIWPIVVRIAIATLRSDALATSVLAAGGLGAAAGPFLGSVLLAGGFAHVYFQVVIGIVVVVASLVIFALVKRRRVA